MLFSSSLWQYQYLSRLETKGSTSAHWQFVDCSGFRFQLLFSASLLLLPWESCSETNPGHIITYTFLIWHTTVVGYKISFMESAPELIGPECHSDYCFNPLHANTSYQPANTNGSIVKRRESRPPHQQGRYTATSTHRQNHENADNLQETETNRYIPCAE